ncbi:CLAVATA3/ESR [Bienertia sinuspersici]
MASLKFWVCLVFLFLSFSNSIARPLQQTTILNNEKHDIFDKFKQLFRERMQRKDAISSYNVSDRVSPGGPDPRHH